jgi:hypothetical protein
VAKKSYIGGVITGSERSLGHLEDRIVSVDEWWVVDARCECGLSESRSRCQLESLGLDATQSD